MFNYPPISRNYKESQVPIRPTEIRKMTSQENRSPSYKHFHLRHGCSPVELKEKLRKSYKDKVKSCRQLLINQFRGSIAETDVRHTLTEIYKSMFNFKDEPPLDENETWEEIKNELIREELNWWQEECEELGLTVDWSLMEDNEKNVICPVCEKTNLELENEVLNCARCQYNIKTDKSLSDIQKLLMSSVDNHHAGCNYQFTVILESTESHMYIICENCTDMQFVI